LSFSGPETPERRFSRAVAGVDIQRVTLQSDPAGRHRLEVTSRRAWRDLTLEVEHPAVAHHWVSQLRTSAGTIGRELELFDPLKAMLTIPVGAFVAIVTFHRWEFVVAIALLVTVFVIR